MGPEIDEPVAVREYDASWPDQFAAEKQRLCGPLAELGVDVEHIGSTAVPGLAAKPIVDILVGVLGPVAEHPVVGRLRTLGYEFLGEAGVPGRLYFQRRSPAHAFNVHVVDREGALWRDNLLLRDYLRTHPAAAQEYAAAKRAAAKSAPESLIRYSELKADAVDALLKRARAANAGPAR